LSTINKATLYMHVLLLKFRLSNGHRLISKYIRW